MATADEQVARKREILKARARGDDVKTIAARHDLSTTRVRQILTPGRTVLADADELDLVQSALERRAQYELLYEQALALFERLPDKNASPKVGALRQALAALDRLSNFEQTVGLIPATLKVRKELDLLQFAEAMWCGLEEAGVPKDAIAQAFESVHALLQNTPRLSSRSVDEEAPYE